MEYKGKLYGKVSNRYIPLKLDTEDIKTLQERVKTAESEQMEQARLNGMGSERELALMSKLEEAQKRILQLEAAKQKNNYQKNSS
jgi:hypothetical protein